MSTNDSDNTATQAAGNEKLIAPGGPRDPSHVYVVEDGVQLPNTGEQIHLVRDNGDVAPRIDLDPTSKEPRKVVSGWITYSAWTNRTGSPISTFTTTWTVPQAPTTQSGQTIFLFNGIHTSDSKDTLQPALQWGPSVAGGGNHWTVASWYRAGGRTLHTNPVTVQEGNVLIGKIVLDSQSGGKFNYTSSFTNIPNTSLSATNFPELTMAYEALEVYNITKCSDYPATNSTLMTDVNLTTLTGSPALQWTAVTGYADCGQKTIVAVDGATNGKVDLLYRTAGRWTNWSESALAPPVGIPNKLSAGDPAGYTSFGDTSQQVVYRSSENHIYMLMFLDGVWGINDVTARTGAPVAATDPSGFTQSVSGGHHIVYCGTDGHIYDLWFQAGWKFTDLTATTSAPLSASKPVGYGWLTDQNMHVFFRGTDNHIHDLRHERIQPGTWTHTDLSKLMGAPPATGTPSWYFGTNASDYVVFRSSSGQINAMEYNGTWRLRNLTSLSGGVLALGDPFGFAMTSNSTNHVVYRGVDEHIHDMTYLNYTGIWQHTDVTGAVSAPDAKSDPIGYIWWGDNIAHVIYVSKDNHVRELWNDGFWHQTDVSGATGITDAEGKPTAWIWQKNRSEQVVFRRNGGQLHMLYRFFKG